MITVRKCDNCSWYCELPLGPCFFCGSYTFISIRTVSDESYYDQSGWFIKRYGILSKEDREKLRQHKEMVDMEKCL